jgi:hypothetical protein
MIEDIEWFVNRNKIEHALIILEHLQILLDTLDIDIN